MQLLKSFLYKIKTAPDYQIPLFVLLTFSTLCLLVSWGVELLFHVQPCSLCLIQRYLLVLIVLNGALGLFSQFKTSYAITCQILLVVLFLIGALHSCIQLGIIHNSCSLGTFSKLVRNYHSLFCPQKSFNIFNIPLSLFNSTGSLVSLLLFLTHSRSNGLGNKE